MPSSSPINLALPHPLTLLRRADHPMSGSELRNLCPRQCLFDIHGSWRCRKTCPFHLPIQLICHAKTPFRSAPSLSVTFALFHAVCRTITHDNSGRCPRLFHGTRSENTIMEGMQSPHCSEVPCFCRRNGIPELLDDPAENQIETE